MWPSLCGMLGSVPITMEGERKKGQMEGRKGEGKEEPVLLASGTAQLLQGPRLSLLAQQLLGGSWQVLALPHRTLPWQRQQPTFLYLLNTLGFL